MEVFQIYNRSPLVPSSFVKGTRESCPNSINLFSDTKGESSVKETPKVEKPNTRQLRTTWGRVAKKLLKVLLKPAYD
jgi:hypothetical protein